MDTSQTMSKTRLIRMTSVKNLAATTFARSRSCGDVLEQQLVIDIGNRLT